MSKLLILSADLGFGHASVAKALKAALDARGKADLSVEILNPFEGPGVPFFMRNSQKDYDRRVRKESAFYALTYRISELSFICALVSRISALFLRRSLKKILQEHPADLVISVFHMYYAGLAWYRRRYKTQFPIFAVITELAKAHPLWFRPGPDRYYVANADLAFEASRRGIAREQIFEYGMPVNPGLKKALAEKQQGAIATVVLVASQRVRNLDVLVQALDEAQAPYRLELIAGGDEEKYTAWTSRSWKKDVRIYGRLDSMEDLLSGASLIISKAGGIICAEALALACPLLIVDCIPGQEEGNRDYMLKEGFGAVVEDAEIRCYLEELFNTPGALEAWRKHLLEASKPDAACRLAEDCLKLL